MSDLVGNPEDLFSHNEAPLDCYLSIVEMFHNDNTPMQYSSIFMAVKVVIFR